MRVMLAPQTASEAIVQFFRDHISREHDAAYDGEFLCPDGARAAVRRKQLLIAVDHETIVGALRFYPRKSGGCIALYQYAIAPTHRGKGLLQHMLQTLGGEIPVGVKHNIFYVNIKKGIYYLLSNRVKRGDHVRKIYITRDGDTGSLTEEKRLSSRLANIEQVRADLQRGGDPFLGVIEVEDGLYIYSKTDKTYKAMTHNWNRMKRVPQRNKADSNGVARLIMQSVIAIIVVGILASIFLSESSVIFTFGIPAFVVLLILVGMAEIINLLHRIEKKMK